MMPPTISGYSRRAGFSLIELMMVLVIIGVLVGIFTLSLGTIADDESQEDARRLQTLIELAREEAMLQGRDVGLSFYQQGYEFAYLRQAVTEDGKPVVAWFPIENDRFLRPRALNEETYLGLQLEGKEIVLPFERNFKEEYIPQVYLLSSGEVDPAFSLEIKKSFEENGVEIKYDLNGLVEASEDDD